MAGLKLLPNSGTPDRERRQESIGVTLGETRHFASLMTNPVDPPPPESFDWAYKLAASASARDIDYEEFLFEVEGGIDDGVEYKVLVIRV